jgi:hypothetical protein
VKYEWGGSIWEARRVNREEVFWRARSVNGEVVVGRAR